MKNPNKKSHRIYTSNRIREPWYLKMIFWTLVVILFGGGGVAGYVMLAKFNHFKEAQSIEIDVDKLIVDFESKILMEIIKLDEKAFEDARKLAFEGKELSDEIARLIEIYQSKFNEKDEGYNRVRDLQTKYENLYLHFIELNKVDPRYKNNTNQTQPKTE